jgi:hypothetical protein
MHRADGIDACGRVPCAVLQCCTSEYPPDDHRFVRALWRARRGASTQSARVPICRHAYGAQSSRSAVGRSSSANEELLSTGSTRLAPFSARSLSMYGSRSSSSGSCQ